MAWRTLCIPVCVFIEKFRELKQNVVPTGVLEECWCLAVLCVVCLFTSVVSLYIVSAHSLANNIHVHNIYMYFVVLSCLLSLSACLVIHVYIACLSKCGFEQNKFEYIFSLTFCSVVLFFFRLTHPNEGLQIVLLFAPSHYSFSRTSLFSCGSRIKYLEADIRVFRLYCHFKAVLLVVKTKEGNHTRSFCLKPCLVSLLCAWVHK